MADLISAAQTQIKYAANSIKAGKDKEAADHLAKADAFLARASVAATLAAVDAPFAGKVALATDATPDWTGTWAEAWARYLDGADALLKEQGKPYGRDGAERGSLSRDEQIKLATDLGVLDELTASTGGVNPFGPEPDAGTIA